MIHCSGEENHRGIIFSSVINFSSSSLWLLLFFKFDAAVFSPGCRILSDTICHKAPLMFRLCLSYGSHTHINHVCSYSRRTPLITQPSEDGTCWWRTVIVTKQLDLLRIPSSFSSFFIARKRNSSSKNVNTLEIYSPSGHPKCRWVCFFIRTD